MEASLYGEGGFYQTRRPTQDFYTAPELHPAFGHALALELAARLEAVRSAKGLWLVEAGCGDGRLFRSVLVGLRAARPELFDSLRFALVDRSSAALRAALDGSRELGGRLVGAATLASLPAFDGVLYSNELLDALPCHLLEKKDGRVWEVGTDPDGKPTLGEPTSEALAREAGLVAPALAEGARHSVCLDRAAWLELASSKLRRGFLISVDYGRRYPAGTPVPVKTYRRHRLGDEPFEGPCDITANVDFERMIEEGRAFGFELESFETLASFLIRRGIAERLEKASDYSERNRLKTLVHPEGMGEIFKVLIQKKGIRGE